MKTAKTYLFFLVLSLLAAIPAMAKEQIFLDPIFETDNDLIAICTVNKGTRFALKNYSLQLPATYEESPCDFSPSELGKLVKDLEYSAKIERKEVEQAFKNRRRTREKLKKCRAGKIECSSRETYSMLKNISHGIRSNRYTVEKVIPCLEQALFQARICLEKRLAYPNND